MTRNLLTLSFLLLTASVGLLATGGFATVLFGVRVSAHSAAPTAVAALAFAAVWVVAARRAGRIARDLADVYAWIDARAREIVLVAASLAGAVALSFGTFSASGSDPSGYFSEAAMLASRALSRPEPLAAIADWPGGSATLAPLGWRAAEGAVQVPTYAVGLPLLMAIPHALGGTLAASSVVAVSAALAVWFAGRIGLALAGPVAGVLAAVWVATMPIEIYESVQPMSDVPVTAAWLACWWWIAKTAAKGPDPRSWIAKTAEKGTVPFMAVSAGLAAAAAVLIRPNLAPLAAIPWLYLTMRGLPRTTIVSLLFALPVALSGVFIAYLQSRYFGSPFRSGYGSAREIYSLSNIAPNAALYLRWLFDTHGPWLLAAPIAAFVSARTTSREDGPPESLLRWMLVFAALVCVAYFAYAVFEDWAYLRFLLPALAIAAIAVSVVVAMMIAKLPVAARAPVIAALVLAIAATQIGSARELDVFRVASRQSRALLAGRYLAAALPEHVVLLAGEQSGAMRYHTDRSILRWDFLDAASLSLAEARLLGNGRELWVVLDDWEVPKFREKLRAVEHAGLDWPPAVEAGRQPRTMAWRVVDRARFMAGERVITDRLR